MGIGNVSMTDLLTTQPFGNTIDYFVAPVKVLKEALQFSASTLSPDGQGRKGSFLQVGGLKFTIDLSRSDKMNRVTKLVLKHSDGSGYFTPSKDELVRIITSSYLATNNNGNGKWKVFEPFEVKSVGTLDVDIMKWQFQKMSPVNQKTDGRI